MIVQLYKRLPEHLRVASISWVSRGIYVLASLYSIKIVTSLLSVNDFAIYAIITSIVSWLLLTDIGLGYSLQNFISENRAKSKAYDEDVFVTLLLTYLLALFFIVVILIFNRYLSVILFDKINTTSIGSLNNGLLYSSIAGLLTGVGIVSHKILYAKQQGYWPNILNALSAIVTLILLFYLQFSHYDSLFVVLMIFFIPNIFITFIPSLYFFISSYVKLRSSLTFSSIWLVLKKISSRGLNFFVFTFSSAIVLQMDYIVMSQTVSASEISLYNIVFKIYSAFFLVYSTLLLALWPSISEWYIQNHFSKIKDYCIKYIIAGVVFIMIASIIFVLKTDLIFGLISNISFKISLVTIGLFAFYFSIRVWTDTYSIVLLSTSKVRSLWLFTPFQAIVSFSFQLLLSKKYGINGILCALIISFLSTVSWGLPYQVRKILK